MKLHAQFAVSTLLLLSSATRLFACTYQDDAARANQIRTLAGNSSLNVQLDVHWLEDDTQLWFKKQLSAEQSEFILVDTSTGKSQSLTEKPTDGTKAKKSEKRRPRPTTTPPSSNSPNHKHKLTLRDHNLFLQSDDQEQATQLTTDGKPGHSYDPNAFWSPNSNQIIVLHVLDAQSHPVHLIESSPKDQLQPKLHTHNYLKPGDQIQQVRPRLFDITSQLEIPVDPSLFNNPWDLRHLHFSPDGNEFRFVYNQRGHQVMRVIGINTTTGQCRSIINETSDTFIDYSQKHFVRFLPDSDEILWTSERDGYHHLYLYQASTGTLKNQITTGPWIVSNIEHVDQKNRQITFKAMGIFPDQDPYHVHLARINFDGSYLIHLTDGDGTHTLTHSPTNQFYIDTYSRVDLPPIHELRRLNDGTKICELARATTSASLPQRFTAKGRDGTTDIYGIIIRPSNFDPSKKYPIIEKIYAGPHGHFVPKNFSPYLSAQTVAEHGFILVQIDGMGTNFRSKAFHDVCWKNLMDSGFPDRIAWIKAAATQHPELDLNRIGIYGGSAGGQSTLAGMLNFPEFYKVGVSDCGCHDNRMDKIWWNEAWMGTMGDHYAANSNVTHAHKLQGKLLLTVGELDRNVDPASTMQVVNALIKADRDFDMIVVPGADHGVGESPYMSRRRTQFFIEHLK